MMPKALSLKIKRVVVGYGSGEQHVSVHAILCDDVNCGGCGPVLPDCQPMPLLDIQIAEAEWRVVQAAVAYRKRNELKWESECIKVCNELDEAIDDLITLRNQAENNSAPQQS